MMCVCNIFTNYHGQGNWLVSSDYFSGSLLATESPCYIAGCESRQHLQASDIFRETARECILNKWLCHLANEPTGFFRIIETYFETVCVI